LGRSQEVRDEAAGEPSDLFCLGIKSLEVRFSRVLLVKGNI